MTIRTRSLILLLLLILIGTAFRWFNLFDSTSFFFDQARDPIEQKNRFSQEVERAEGHGRTQVKPDLDFIKALEKGLPQCAGIAIGVDRLAMLFTDSRDISEVLWLS
jgi:lysyl-tRNA synthetase class II